VEWVKNEVRLGIIRSIHIGLCCSTFTTARHPSLRTPHHPEGKPGLTDKEQIDCNNGNTLAEHTVEIFRFILDTKAKCSISCENPAGSYVWKLQSFRDLARDPRISFVRTAYCAWGRGFQKLTTIMSNVESLPSKLNRPCCGLRVHEKRLAGDPRKAPCVKSSEGNAYPPRMTKVWAATTTQAFQA